MILSKSTIFDIHASIINVDETGLNLTDFQVDIYRITISDKSVSHLITDAALSVEVGGGFYSYYLLNCDLVSYDYLVIVQYIGSVDLDQVLWFGQTETSFTTGSLLMGKSTLYLEDQAFDLELENYEFILGLEDQSYDLEMEEHDHVLALEQHAFDLELELE